jgi:predicted P-loop ATPase
MSAAPSLRAVPDPFTSAEIAHYYKVRAPQVKQAGSEWRGPCPLHHGTRDSFAVDPKTGEWYCHSDCSRGGSMIGFEMELSGKSFAEAAAEVRAVCGRTERRSKGSIVASYDYVDEDGKLLFQCLRYEPKAFSQRRPNGRGGWISNLQGVRRVLFRLPEITKEESVLVAEGEKDILSLVKVGFPATCNPMGAEKWRPEYSDQLAGKHVVIFPDNDASGKKHASQVGRSLVGKAASVRIGHVPVGKDVSDWIARGATKEDIQAAIEAATDFMKTAEAERSVEAVDWRSNLLTNEKGFPKALLANAITALRWAPEWAGVLGFNEFSLGTVALKAPPWQSEPTGKEWTDHEDRLAADWLQHQDILVTVEVAGQAVQAVARDRCFHPVKDYVNSLSWDGVKRIDVWLSQYLGAELTDYSKAVGARWLISAVARIYNPGVKADCCLILEGEQGTKKSTALRILAGDWFTDEIAELGSKDAAMQTRGVWIIEIAELDSMSRTEVGKIKAFMSRAVDRFRPPYDKRLVNSPRQCVFAGSVNHRSYLRDETGARRFWPVACGTINTEDLTRDRDQLWAEARDSFRADSPWWLETRELTAHAEEEQADRCEEDPWQEPISSWTESRADASISEILGQCIDKPVPQWTQQDRNRIARCLRAMGWVRHKTGPRGGREWRYKRP